MAYRPISWNEWALERREQRLRRDAKLREMHIRAEFEAEKRRFDEEFILAVDRHRRQCEEAQSARSGVWRAIREWFGQ